METFGNGNIEHTKTQVAGKVLQCAEDIFQNECPEVISSAELADIILKLFHTAAKELDLPEIEDEKQREKKQSSLRTSIRNHIIKIADRVSNINGATYTVVKTERGFPRVDRMNLDLLHSILVVIQNDLDKYYSSPNLLETRIRPPLYYFFAPFCVNPDSDIFTNRRRYYNRFNCSKLCIDVLVSYLNSINS